MADQLNSNGAIKQATLSVKLDYLINQVADVSDLLEKYHGEHEARLRVLEQIASGAGGTLNDVAGHENRLRALEIASAKLGERVTDVGRWNGLGSIVAAIAGIFIKTP